MSVNLLDNIYATYPVHTTFPQRQQRNLRTVGARTSKQNTDTVRFNMDISTRSCQGGTDIDHLQFLVQSQMSFAGQDFVRALVLARESFTTSQNVSSFGQFLGQGAIIKNNNQKCRVFKVIRTNTGSTKLNFPLPTSPLSRGRTLAESGVRRPNHTVGFGAPQSCRIRTLPAWTSTLTSISRRWRHITTRRMSTTMLSMTSSVTTHMRIFLFRPRLIKLPLLSLPIRMLRHAGAAWDDA
jgi:hypothetical protein